MDESSAAMVRCARWLNQPSRSVGARAANVIWLHHALSSMTEIHQWCLESEHTIAVKPTTVEKPSMVMTLINGRFAIPVSSSNRCSGSRTQPASDASGSPARAST